MAVGDGEPVEVLNSIVVVGAVVVPLSVDVVPETVVRGVLVALVPEVEDAVRVGELVASSTILLVSQTTS